MPEIRWTLDVIKSGIEQYASEFGRPPTAIDFDLCPYLPSARQIQRAYGGLESLRRELGYDEANFTKGRSRSQIASAAGVRGIAAEELLEVSLIKHFGEPFVHTQKRYIRGGKSRYDFFIYANDISFGIDIFATGRKEYIDKNVRHKIKRYATTSHYIPIYFVVHGEYQAKDITSVQQLLAGHYPNIKLYTYEDFLTFIATITPLPLPDGFKSIIQPVMEI